MNKNGQMIMVNLLILVMTIAILVAVVPVFNTILGVAKQSNYLNCPGYDYDKSGTVGDHMYDYNATLSDSTDRISCIAIGLYVPYIVLAILIAGVTKLLTSRRGPYESDTF